MSGGRSGWLRVNLPAPITQTIDRLKKERGEPRWRVIARALLTYAAIQDDLDRRLYYVNKLLTGWTYVKVYISLRGQKRVTDEEVNHQIKRFKKTLMQIQDRLHIRTIHLIPLLDSLAKGANGRKIAEINDEIREIIKALLVAEVGGES